MKTQNYLLELTRDEIKRRKMSVKTENAYLNHIRRFLEFSGVEEISVKRADKVRRFLEYLKPKAADATRNQAHSALLFFYGKVLGQPLSPRLENIRRVPLNAKKRTVFTDAEARKILENLHGACYLVAALVYGSGLRLPEALVLRVGDLDFAESEIKIRNPQNGKIERRAILPASLENPLRRHLVKVEYLHEDDLLSGYGQTSLPRNIAEQSPNTAVDFAWQYIFPASKLTATADGKSFARLHLAESTVQKAISEALEKAQIKKTGGCQTLRYSFASRLFEQNCGVRTISRLLGHKNVKTTVGYFGGQALNNISSPLD